MKISRLVTRSIVVLVVSAMLLVMAACGTNVKNPADASTESTTTSSDTSSQTGEAAQKNLEPVTVTLLYNEAGHEKWNQWENGPVQQEIKRVTGVTLKLQAADDNKWNVIVASGDLPDMIQAITNAKMSQLITGEHVLAMDDLIKSNGQEIEKAMPDALNFSRKFWSNNTNKLYYLPVQVGADDVGLEPTIGASIRWKAYQDIGAPAINSEDDLLNALAEMVKKNPKTAEGKTVYGVGFWSDWGTWPYMYSMAPMFGYQSLGASGAVKVDTNEYADMVTDRNAPWWKAVGFFYKANKLGIFDKDSFIMKFDDWSAKCTAGQELYTPASWACGDYNKNTYKDSDGYIVLPMDWGFQWAGGTNIPGWLNKSIGITTDAKNPDRVMDLLNYMWSYEGGRTLYSGAKGVQWDMVDGKPKLKDETLKMRAEGGDAWVNTGIQGDLNIIGLSGFLPNPADGAPLNLFETPDVYETIMNPLQKAFAAHYGVKYPGEIFKKKIQEGKNKNQKDFNGIAAAIMPPVPDDLKRIETKINEIAPKEFAKCILSKTDAEFEVNVENAIKNFKAAGSDKYAEWFRTNWSNSVAASK